MFNSVNKRERNEFFRWAPERGLFVCIPQSGVFMNQLECEIVYGWFFCPNPRHHKRQLRAI